MADIDDMINFRAKSSAQDNKSTFKAKDLDLIKQVTSFLDSYGLQYEIKGSAVENILKGRARDYNDIDILVKRSNNFDGRYHAMMTFSKIAAGNPQLAPTIPSFSDYIVHKPLFSQMYMSVYADALFEIARDNPSTKIHVAFEGTRNQLSSYPYRTKP